MKLINRIKLQCLNQTETMIIKEHFVMFDLCLTLYKKYFKWYYSF